MDISSPLFSFRPLVASFVIAGGLSACGDKDVTVAPQGPAAYALADIPHAQLGTDVTPSAYRIDLRLNPDDVGYSGVVEIDVDVTTETSRIWFHAKNMTVTDARAVQDGADIPLAFTAVAEADAPSGVAFLTPDTALTPGQATLHIPFSTPFNLALNSAYKVERDGDAYVVTQFEPLGAREAFPSFDESRFKVPFTLSITSPEDDFVYANTPEISATPQADGWVKHDFATTRPLPTYLIAFGAGPYDVVDGPDLAPTDVRERTVKLRGITARGSGADIAYGLEHTAGILDALENYFGIPYPYEKLDLIAAPEYAFGAMENPGAIVYREYLMLMDDDAALSQKRAYARVHSHELAHQWFGNLVTPVWWEDIWLNEAFATWMGNKGTSLWNPEGNFDRLTLNASLGAMNIDTLSTTRKVREPLLRSENVIDQFDGITYRKGGGVLSMFESYLGEETFQSGVRLHMKRYADDVASADDFFQSVADASGDATVVDAMKSFVDQPGLPLVSADLTCTDGQAELSLSQSRYAPLGSKTQQGQMWQIPVCAKLGYADGTSSKTCSLMTEPDMTQTLELDACPVYMTPNENGAGYYRFSLDSEGWQGLIDNLDTLNTREVLTVQDSFDAAFNAGHVDADIYLRGLEAFAKSSEHDVASSAGDKLSWFSDHLPESAKADIARLTQDMYATRYKAIVGKDTVEGNLLSPTLAQRLVDYGQDETLEADFAKKGAAYLGLDGEVQKDAVAPNLLSRALRTVMKARGEDAVAPLLAMVKSGSSFEKGAALGALGQAPTPELAAAMRERALNDTDHLTGRQATSLVTVLMSRPEEEAATWAWLKDNFEPFVTSRVPDVRKGGMPGLAKGFCDLDKRDEAKAFFESQAAVIPGYERSLLQTVESIELCQALQAAKSDDLVAALKSR